jgi:hypothetical protein
MRLTVLTMLVTAAIVIYPLSAVAAGLPPWRFGMSKEQTKSFTRFGPYKSFKNGDLETYNGIYHGEKHNVQFFFDQNKLTKIEVLIGEGTDRDKAIAAFQTARALLERDYGKVGIPEEQSKGAFGPDVQAIAAAANAAVTGRTRLNPLNQPKDMNVWASMNSYVVNNSRWFSVAIVFAQR